METTQAGKAACSRRQFVRSVAAGASLGALSIVSGRGVRAAEPDSSRQRTLRIGQLTDVHVQPERGAAQGLAAALQHMHQLDDPPTLLINSGDAIMDSLATDAERTDVQWKLWQRALAEHCPTRIEHCLGNHDVWGWDKKGSGTTSEEAGWGKQRALDELSLPARYRSFDAGGWHFVLLDSIFPDEENVYIGQLDDEQWDWLERDLRQVPDTTPVVVVSHIPILSVAMIEFESNLTQRPSLRRSIVHSDGKRIVDLFRQHPNVKLCLSGHLHLVERIEYGGVAYLCAGAISGNWWKGDHHHVDEGYALVDLYDDGTFDSQYVAYGWDVKPA